jgi:hypothetical protein
MKGLAISICVVALAAASCGRSEKSCAVCQRAECKGLAFRVELSSIKTVETCCPRCALHYLKTENVRARQLWASDYTSGKWIDATKAIYVSGSDVMHCAPTMEARRDAFGCCAFKDFDRCLPSVIAFVDANAAREFSKAHGGEIVAFEKLAAP